MRDNEINKIIRDMKNSCSPATYLLDVFIKLDIPCSLMDIIQLEEYNWHLNNFKDNTQIVITKVPSEQTYVELEWI